MEFNIIPPLTFTSAVSVTASLCFHETRFCPGLLPAVDQTTIMENVDLLPLPENLKRDVKCLIQPIEYEIQAWYKQFRTFLTGRGNFSEKLSWTPLGLIDYGKTAANCISSGDWSDVDAFMLACSGSHPESVLRLWPKVKTEVLREFAATTFELATANRFRPDYWLKIWIAYLNDQMDEFRAANHFSDNLDIRLFLFEVAVKENNIGAARYFMDKIEKDHLLNLLILTFAMDCALMTRRNFKPGVFHFLASCLPEPEMKQLLSHRTLDCLLHLLTWPLHVFFVPATDVIWPEFDFDKNLSTLLQRVLIKIMQTQDSKYRDIFRVLWRKTPVIHRNSFLAFHTHIILAHLFEGYRPEEAVASLFRGDLEENSEKIHAVFVNNPDAVMSLSIEENKAQAFKAILETVFDRENFRDNYEDLYRMFTQAYVDEYYGVNVSSEEVSDDEMSLRSDSD